MKKILALLATLFVVACNPLTIEEPPVLAGDFSDPIYPEIYGRVSIDLALDPKTEAAESGKIDTKSLYLEFYFKTADGQYVLCKEYENYGTMPSKVLFPVGQYVVVARTKDYNPDREYFRGQIEMVVKEASPFSGKLVCLLLADEFADPVYPKIYGQVALDMKLQMGSASSRGFSLPDAQKLRLDFYSKSADGNWSLCKHYDRVGDLPKGVSFPVGNYKLVARSHEAMNEVMKEPYVHGEAQFAVTAQTETNVAVVGSMRNAWVELLPTEAYLRAVHSWAITLREKSLTAPYVRLTKDSTLVRFVHPGEWNLEVEGQQVGDNLPVAYKQALGTLAGGDRAATVLDAVDRGVLAVELNVDVQITRRDHTIVFPDDEGELGTGGYNPNPEPDPDPEPTDPLPFIVGDGIDVDQIATITDADFDSDGKLKYSLKVTATAKTGGIQKFEITIESTHSVLSPETITAIFDGTTFDLANVTPGSNLETNLDGFGILPLGKKIKGDEAFVFDLTDFMGMLPVHTDSHNFTLKVTDGKGKSAQKTIRIKRVK